ncbi:MAG: hypothetical protein BECKG1743D_GA0114223_106553, partial [Candidatus Kentron sp. G]
LDTFGAQVSSDHERYPADVKCLGFLYLYVGRYPRNNASRNNMIGSVYELEQFNDDMVLRDQPAADLKDIYFLEAIPYHKSEVVQVIKIAVFVPEENLDQVKSAMFQAGAGKIGNYDRCCFETRGVGQFRPLQGANPHIGESGGGGGDGGGGEGRDSLRRRSYRAGC